MDTPSVPRDALKAGDWFLQINAYSSSDSNFNSCFISPK